MSLRALAFLQWFGLLSAALCWAASHVVGFGITEARCGVGGIHWGIDHDLWQIALMAASGTISLAALAAAAVVLARTRGRDFHAEPPLGRMYFFSTASLAANILFLGIVLLDGLGSILNVVCRQS